MNQETKRSKETAQHRPNERITFPANARAVVDVTKAPYHCDPTGTEDCTQALIRALDDIVRPWRDELKIETEFFCQNPFEYEGIFEARSKRGGMILLVDPPPAKILYFPNGTYRVSDTITYRFKDLKNRSGAELNTNIQLRGESESGVVIKLDDRCPGFEEGVQRPVISVMGGVSSNASLHNCIENLTIDVGAGNDGAIGIVFFTNDTGAVRHVSIRSSDPDGTGYCGLAIRNRNSSSALFQHVTVEGFDCGVRIEYDRQCTTLEHIHLVGQRHCGMHIDRHNVSLRGLISRNTVPALKVTGPEAVVAFVDSRLEGGSDAEPAVALLEGCLFARNIETQGYRCALSRQGVTEIPGKRISEYVSTSVIALFQETSRRSLDLPVEETPHVPWENDHAKWACANDFGAVGDGVTDDTEAIRRAVASGKPVVWFQPGTYRIDDTIDLPPTLQRLNFMKGNLAAGDQLRLKHGQGAFRVVGDSDTPLVIEDLFTAEKWRGGHTLIDHASRRTLILSDLSTFHGRVYFNSVTGGRVFVENVFNIPCPLSNYPFHTPTMPNFHFRGQQVWARQINPEYNNSQIVNDGGTLWILGFKTEGGGTSFQTLNSGRTEVLGGTINQVIHNDSPPTIINHDSDVCVVCGTTDFRDLSPSRHIMIEERQQGVTRNIRWVGLPIRQGKLIAIPLYVGRAGCFTLPPENAPESEITKENK